MADGGAYASLTTDPVGTPHQKATCCWCQSHLVIGEAAGGLRCWVCPRCWARQEAHALYVVPAGKAHATLIAAHIERLGGKPAVKAGERACLNMPLPSQVLFEECPAKNVLWGGQAGPGKSHGVRWWLYKRSLMVNGHEALLTRENWEQLEKHHLRAMAADLPLFGARLVDKTAVFPNRSFIDCGHMADFEAVNRYLSTNYGAIVPEEGSRTPVDSRGVTPLAELATRARNVYRDVQGREVRPRFMPVSNPGGPSSGYLCEMFVDHTPNLELYPKLAKKYRPEQWVYIPARLDDNPYMDPEYEDTLSGLDAVRYEQMRNGDWHIFAGAFFSEFVADTHVAHAVLA